MATTRSHIATIVITLLSTLVVVMAVYILFRFAQTNKMPASVPVATTSTTPVDPGLAFIKLLSATTPVNAGQFLTVVFNSNDWSVCAVDLYRPDESSLVLTKEASKPAQISSGRFSWTWKVPFDEAKGQWTARFLCGKADNLATVDQAFEVR